MGLSSLIFVVTPTYAQIGILAPILVVLARLVQGFAIGGEMVRDRAVMRRRLGEGVEFLRFLARRRRAANPQRRAARSSETVAKS